MTPSRRPPDGRSAGGSSVAIARDPIHEAADGSGIDPVLQAPRLRLGIVTQYYPPETGAPQARLSELAEALVRRGHEVVVVTSLPNYPIGRIFPGYGGLGRSETRNGVRVLRTLVYPTQSTRMVRRLASYLSFAASSLIQGAVRLPRLDYVLTESPPLFLGPSGYLISRWTRARWIFNVSDLWPSSAVDLGVVRPGMALRMSEALEAFCYRHAWLVSGQSPSIIRNVEDRFAGVRTYLLTNGADSTRFRPDAATAQDAAFLRPRDGTECVALYAGLHGIAQGLEQVVEAARSLRHEPGLGLALVGSGPTKAALQAQAASAELSNLAFLDPQPSARMPGLVAAADIALVVLGRDILGAVPSKLYEAMAAGRPVILVAKGDGAAIVRSADAGIVVDPGDVAGLVDAIRRLARDPALRARYGANGRAAAIARFDRARIVEEFERYLLDHLTAPGAAASGSRRP